ncbi:MAG TPA: WD40 repeat domain-containing protein [Bacteroidales bacterium]|nr:WD40 repeat domain-containing protein [Bacteroidales bacterium]
MESSQDVKDFNPFPGLRPFSIDESKFFFGREAEAEDLILKLLKNRYVTVIGASGTGKSSLVFAAVVPAILKLKNGSSAFRIISFRPGKNPFGNLAEALIKGIDNEEKSIDDTELCRIIKNHNNFSDAFRQITKGVDENILLNIDQFEDLFRFGSSELSEEDKIKFIEFLVNTIKKNAPGVYIILSMRSEYMGECSHHWELARLINNSNYLVPEPGIENWKKIIEEPAKLAGARIESELTEGLLNDIRYRNDQFPVLQHSLMRIWEHWQRSGDSEKQISITDYNSIGTVKNAIDFHGNEIYAELNERGKEICAILFKSITRKGSDNKGLRQPCDIGTIKSIAGCSDEELFEVIDKFRHPAIRFIGCSEEVLGNNTVIDLQNECIIHLWGKLVEWVDDEASSMQIYMRLSEASALYQQGKTGLYRQPDLQTAINWREKQKPDLLWAIKYNPAFERAMVYLRTSEKVFLEEESSKAGRQKGALRKIGLLTGFFGIIIVLALGFTIFEYIQKLKADRQTSLSEKQKALAIRQKETADSTANAAIWQKNKAESLAAIAVRDAQKTNELKIIAEKQISVAKRTTDEAMHQKKLAIEQSSGNQRLRMISIGKALSLKSMQLMGQKDLQTLLAYQAYLFTKNNNGPDNDPDIYAGLYNVALQYGSINCKSYKDHSGEIRSIAFLPGKDEFFTSCTDGKILKWSLDNKDQALQVVYSGSDIIDVLAVSPDASWLACGSSNSSIRMIPLKGNNISYELTGHKGEIKSLIFSFDGKYLYSAAVDGKVLKWDIAARTSVNVSTGLMEIVSLDISSKGNYLAGLSTDGKVIVWNKDNDAEKFRLETAGKNIKVIRFSPENNLLAIGYGDGNVELWDIDLHKKISEVNAHNSMINNIQFNANLKQMATSGMDKKIKIFNVRKPTDLTEPPVIIDNKGFVLVMQFSPDGQMIVSGESGEAGNLMSRPANTDGLVRDICNLVSRNMTQEEWNTYVGKDVPIEKTCPEKGVNIKVEQKIIVK